MPRRGLKVLICFCLCLSIFTGSISYSFAKENTVNATSKHKSAKKIHLGNTYSVNNLKANKYCYVKFTLDNKESKVKVKLWNVGKGAVSLFLESDDLDCKDRLTWGEFYAFTFLSYDKTGIISDPHPLPAGDYYIKILSTKTSKLKKYAKSCKIKVTSKNCPNYKVKILN